MKKFIAGFVLGSLIFGGIAFAQTRETLFRSWGPQLLEAIVLVIRDEINTLRQLHGLPDRTNQQIITAIDTKLQGLTRYQWMIDKDLKD